mmetsp:Transcript_45254/g.145604  ORF Transcript_45254/g.145604 Transcript_45254/m.145604 type:complete len:378 (+) Transcript_45254:1147-2280(+)
MLARREVDERAQRLAAADASDDEQVDATVVEERARRELRGGREPARVARPHGEEWRLERAPRLAALRLEAQPARVLPLREHQPEGPHVEASLAHPAEVLRAEVEVRGEGPLHREEAVEEAPLRRLRDAHHVEPLSAATAEEARRRNRPGRLSRRLEQRDAQRVCRAAGQHADREGGDGGVGVLPREEAVDQLVHHPVPAHAHHGVHLGRLDLRSDFPHVPRVRRHHLGQRDAVRLEEGAAAGVDAPRVARARHRVDQHQPPLLTRRRRVGSHAVHDIPHRCCPPLGLAAVAAGHPGLRGLAVRRAEAAAAVQRHAMQHQLAALGGGTDAVGERHRLHAACRRQRHVLDDLPRHVEPPAARLLAQESGVAEEELLRAH